MKIVLRKLPQKHKKHKNTKADIQGTRGECHWRRDYRTFYTSDILTNYDREFFATEAVAWTAQLLSYNMQMGQIYKGNIYNSLIYLLIQKPNYTASLSSWNMIMRYLTKMSFGKVQLQWNKILSS